MELREILNRAEGVIINAKSFAAGSNLPEVQSQLLNLKAFLNKELMNHPFQSIESIDEPEDEQPAEQADIENLKQEVTGLGKDLEDLAGQPAVVKVAEPAVESTDDTGLIQAAINTASESKPGSGVVSEPAESKSKPGAGVVSEPDKSQNKDGSGVA